MWVRQISGRSSAPAGPASVSSAPALQASAFSAYAHPATTPPSSSPLPPHWSPCVRVGSSYDGKAPRHAAPIPPASVYRRHAIDEICMSNCVNSGASFQAENVVDAAQRLICRPRHHPVIATANRSGASRKMTYGSLGDQGTLAVAALAITFELSCLG